MSLTLVSHTAIHVEIFNNIGQSEMGSKPWVYPLPSGFDTEEGQAIVNAVVAEQCQAMNDVLGGILFEGDVDVDYVLWIDPNMSKNETAAVMYINIKDRLDEVSTDEERNAIITAAEACIRTATAAWRNAPAWKELLSPYYKINTRGKYYCIKRACAAAISL